MWFHLETFHHLSQYCARTHRVIWASWVGPCVILRVEVLNLKNKTCIYVNGEVEIGGNWYGYCSIVEASG